MRNWTKRERGLGVALALIVVAAIAVPAWADDGAGEVAAEPAPSVAGEEDAVPEPDGLGDCLRRHGAPLPAIRPEGDELPAPPPVDDQAFGRAGRACGLPEPPPGTDPFPLSDQQIEAERAKLNEFVRCMRAHGERMGDPEVERDRIAIPLAGDAFREEFLAAQRACGGPPGPPAR